MLERVSAGNHYCPRGYQVEIDLTVRRFQDERIIGGLMEDSEPQESKDGLDHSVREPIRCSWLIKANHLTSPRQLVLEGVLKDNHEAQGSIGRHSIQYELPKPDAQANCSNQAVLVENVNLGLFRVVPIISRYNYLSVSFVWKNSQSASPVVLRAVMPQIGFCSRDMLSFNGSCFAISQVRENITLAASNIKGDAQLASFISMAQIFEFIAANNARLGVQPYRRPLDFNQPVRIGIYYRASDDKVVTLSGKNGCKLIPIEMELPFLAKRSTGACAILRINATNEPVVEFGNCSQEMPTLVRFPETPGCSDRACEKELSEYIESIIGDAKPEEHRYKITESGNLALISILIGCVISIILLISATVMALKITCRRRNLSVRLEQDDHAEDTQVIAILPREESC